jgi:hypothetical protein
MSNRFYIQQQGHSEVRLHRVGEWVEAEWDGRRISFRLRPCRILGQDRLLLRFRESSACQQVLLRVEGEKLLFKSAYTVAAQRFEPRRTAIDTFGVGEGDLLIGSDVWSVDFLLAERFARPASAVLRASSGGLFAVACRDAALAVLGEGEEAAIPATGPLRLVSAEALRSRDAFSATFLADDVLYEVSNGALGDERAQLRLAAVGYVLPLGLSRITLGAGEDCIVPLYAGSRRRAAEEAVWNLWFEALRCRAEPGTVVSAVGLEPGGQAGSAALGSLLDSYLRRGVAAPSVPSQERQAADVSAGAAEAQEPPPALVDKSFVLNKCEEVLTLVGDRADLGADVRRLRTLLAQGDYHQASLLAEELRRRHVETARPAPALDHGLRLRVGGTEMWFLDRRRLQRQEAPEVREVPGLLLLAEPLEICQIAVVSGTAGERRLEVAPPGGASVACSELRFGRLDPLKQPPGPMPPAALAVPAEPGGVARVGLAPSNLSVSSQAARIVADGAGTCIEPWRTSVFEGDAVIRNFQLVLEHPSDRCALQAEDLVVLGNLLFDFIASGSGLLCRLRGALLDRGEEPFVLGSGSGVRLDLPLPGGDAQARVRFHPGARLVEGDFLEEDGAVRVGPVRVECRRGERGVTLLLAPGNAGPALRFGRAEGGALRYSQRKRVTRVRHAPLYPVAPELFVGVGWQAEQDGAGVEVGVPGARPCSFRIAVRRGLEGQGEIVCQASAETLGTPARTGLGAQHLRGGTPSPDERLLPGDELVCPPAVFRVAAAPEGEGLELALDLVRLEVAEGEGGWLAGPDAATPEGGSDAIVLPPPFPRSARVRWTSGGLFRAEGDVEALDRELVSLPVPAEPEFRLYEAAVLERARLRVGGPGSAAEVVHEGLEAGRLVATVEAVAQGWMLRPLGPEARLWLHDAAQRVEPVPAEGLLLTDGARFGMGQAELAYEIQAVS